ncbi:hypothetical protein [Vitiosangium sp. GDMCC 1.1324]|uniref:hypothetical protein n=1 Tax=Vitiosangium sp. (strain GDMCC 1.1324) TaxID=2138576 RepID=UPI000D333E1F|nr:hypothetical protein [Vitiosangium sp. GDMCC 1.1324]PTL79611.1 hypothetical protein DAT35_32900 [Vitiosangium sp. GDMCC 1.1324]
MKTLTSIRNTFLMSALILASVPGCQGDEPTAEAPPSEGLAQSPQGLACDTNLVPVMTGPTTPSGIVTRSGVYSSSYEAYLAFDGNASSMFISQVGQTPATLGYEFPSPKTITRYALQYSNGSITTRAPKNWTLEAFNGSAWVAVDTRSNEINWSGSERREYAVASPGSYSKYRLNVSDDNDSRTGIEVISLGGFELIGCACENTNQVPVMTGPTTPSGIVTRSGVYSSSYEAYLAFDASASSMFISQVGQTPATIGYEWTDGPRTINRYALQYSNGSITTRAPKNWTLEAFNGSAWVAVDTRSNELNWSGSERREYAVASPGSYSKYRLNVSDDNDSRTGIEVISLGGLEFIGCR